MSTEVSHKVRRVSMVGANALEQEGKLNRKLKNISYEPGSCYYRPTLKSYFRNEKQEDGSVSEVYMPGLASHWMFQEMLGIPVKDQFLGNEIGIELPLKYAKEVADDLLVSIQAFDTTEEMGKVNYKKAYANFLRYLVNFAYGYSATEDTPEEKNIERSIQAVYEIIETEPTEEQKANPDFDADAAVIEAFKEVAQQQVSKKSELSVYEAVRLTAQKAIKAWSIKNTDIQTAVTFTCQSNFITSLWGSIEPAENDNGVQLEQFKVLSSFAAFITQHNFEAGGHHGNADRDSEAYKKAFSDWIGSNKGKNQLMSSPKPNGVAFILSQECVAQGTSLVKKSGQDPEIEEGIFSWSDNKTKIVRAEKNTGELYADPDVCQMVYKYNASTDKKIAGQKLSFVPWLGTPVPFEKIARYKEETMHPTTCDRIRNFQPINLEAVKAEFKKYYVNMDKDWIMEEDLTKYKKAIELFMGTETVDDIAEAMNSTVTVGGVESDLSISQIVDDEDDEEEPAAKPTPKPVAKPTVKPTPKPSVKPTPKPSVKPSTKPTPKTVTETAPESTAKTPTEE